MPEQKSRSDENTATSKPPFSKLAVASYVFSMAGPCLFIPWSIVISYIINSMSNGPQDTTGYAFLCFYTAPIGVLLGAIALIKTRRSQIEYRGKNYAKAGVIIGVIITLGMLMLDSVMRFA